jgi:hypothetical protein
MGPLLDGAASFTRSLRSQNVRLARRPLAVSRDALVDDTRMPTCFVLASAVVRQVPANYRGSGCSDARPGRGRHKEETG